MTTVVLASASPARLALLRAAGLDPQVRVSGVDESTVDDSDPRALCATLARMKAQAVADELRVDGKGVLVLGCDSVLEFEGQVHGKPADSTDAVRRWRRIRGKSGTLHTGHCLIEVGSGSTADEVGSTVVTFADVSDGDIDAYVGTGEPLAVAGAFTIDGLGGWFVERLDGDHGNVVGVSLPVVRRLFASLGHPVKGLWRGLPSSV